MQECRLVLLVIGLFLCLNTIVVADTDPSIVLYFSFDEDNGATVIDLSGSGNDGVAAGTQWVEGQYGHALKFDGETSQIEVRAAPALDLTDGMTIMAWIHKTRFLPANNGETIVSKKQGGGYSLEASGWENRFPEKLSAEPRISGTYHPVESPDALPLNRWVHTAVTYDGDLVRLYVDGEIVTEEAWPGTLDVNTANLYVGAESDGVNPDATHGRFEGMIDDVIVANRGFSKEEVQVHMEGLSVSPLGNLSVVWANVKVE